MSVEANRNKKISKGNEMKKTVYITLILVAIIATACGSDPNNINPATGPQGDPATGALPEATQLLIGTLKLEDTNQAVTAEQAAELLPLWQTMQVLSESDTAAQQEIEALITQIQETMTAEQRQAIIDMSLTREDMMSILQEQGLAMGGAPAGGQSNNPQGGNPNGGGGFSPGEFPGGAPPQGGFPGGGPGGGGGPGSGLTPDQIATAQASRQQGGGSLVSPMLINALVQYLQEKAGA
jgi:hypothetical protein